MANDKRFAIDHMNKDHTLALYDYVNAFDGQHLDVDNHSRTKLELVDISLEEMLLQWQEDDYLRTATVKFDPPMNDMSELRTRVTLLAFEAADRLGVAPSRITEYKHWQGPVDAVPDLLVMFMVWKAVSGWQLASLWSNSATRFIDDWATFALLMALKIHIWEIFALVLPHLRAYRVTSPAYWKWIVATFIGGFRPVQRLNALVKAKEEHRKSFIAKFGLGTTGAASGASVASTSGANGGANLGGSPEESAASKEAVSARTTGSVN